MQTTSCAHCNTTSVPINESILIDEKVYCKDCYAANFSEQSFLEGKQVSHQLDPTVCSQCGADHGDEDLPRFASLPVCEPCLLKLRERTFPLWVKGFLCGIAAIILFSFFWNWKFYQAYKNLNEATSRFSGGDVINAAGLMKKASDEVPESRDLTMMSSYMHGIVLLTQDKPKEALAAFERCKLYPDIEYAVNPYVIQARAGASFEDKDYDGFLEASNESLALDSSQAVSWASIGSAYACKYAISGIDSLKHQAMNYLESAKALDSTSQEMKFYYSMIEYRLYSRKIISREDFARQFPNGWQKN